MNLVVENLQKKFGEKEVLRGVTYTFEQGRIYGLLGRNGAGKTTFFNCVNEDLPLDGGRFFVESDGVSRAATADDVGYVLSTPVVPEFLTGREFLKFFTDINRDKIRQIQPLDRYFDFVQIAPEDRDRLLKDYSHGMKNKMQMLINFIANPGILLLDEPLTSFDVVVADEMKQLLRSIKGEHIIIFSTHIMELALDLCDTIVILSDGVLEEIPKEHLDNAAFKDKIIAALRGEDDA
jgi:ABC-2 type transport system ATP-binding protein